MYLGNDTRPVAVWVFIYHENGKLTVTQSVINKEEFGLVQRGMRAITKWVKDNLKASSKCPYSPANAEPVHDDAFPSPNDTVTHYSGTDNEREPDDATRAEQVRK